MQKIAALIVVLLLSPAIAIATAEQNEAVVSTTIDNVESAETRLIECFTSISAEDCAINSQDDLVLNWWPWSDETNSNWPDDDAKARAGELLLNLSQNNPLSVANEELTVGQANENRQQIEDLLPIISLSGELNVYKELDGHRVEIPITMTPLVNLSDSTIMYIYLSKEYSIDDHNRRLNNLVYEMKPEFGFSNQENNSTETTWILSESHLSAAGVDFAESPYGWSVTFALFGELEGSDTNQLLYLNQVELSTQKENVELDQFLVPIFAIVFGIIVITTILGNMYKEEHGMPIISGYWHREKANCLVVEFTTKSRRMEIKSLEADAPWKLSSRFKSRFIEANKSVNIELKFKQPETTDCRLHIKLEVDELGVWTQFLAITTNID